MFAKFSRRLNQAVEGQRTRQRQRIAATPVRQAAVDALEERRLLSFSISANALSGPIATTGASWSYHQDQADGGTSDETLVIGSPTTFQGHPAIETTDNTNSIIPGTGTNVFNTTSYIAILPAGPVFYGGTASGNVSGTINYSPYEQNLPAQVTVGVPYTFNWTETDVGESRTVLVDVTHVSKLVSETTTSVVVPAGTFDCYEIDETTTRAVHGGGTGTDTYKLFCAPGIGMVEEIQDNDPPRKLTGLVKKNETLRFQQGPSETQAGNAIKPPIVVEIDSDNGSRDATGSYSNAFVTLSLTDGSALGGTLTVQAVGGLATFSDISIATAGSYTLKASVDAVTPITSSVTIDTEPTSDLDSTLARLKVPTTAVGGSKVNINANVTVTNNTESTVSGPAKVTAFLVGPAGATPAAVRLGSNFVASPADTVMLQIGKTVTQKVNLKPHKAAHLSVHITSLPNVPVAGSYALEFVVTDPKGNSVTVIGPSLTVGPAVITLSETIAAIKLPSTITIGQKLKAASIKLIVKNSGNVQAKGKTVFSVSASATPGVAGTPIQSTPIVLNTLPGKTKPVTINVKSLPALAAGSYYIVIQATDSLGGTSSVSSASPVTVSA